mgnify:FL=1
MSVQEHSDERISARAEARGSRGTFKVFKEGGHVTARSKIY